MRTRWVIAFVATIGIVAVAVFTLSDRAPEQPKEGGLRRTNTPSHGGGGVLGST